MSFKKTSVSAHPLELAIKLIIEVQCACMLNFELCAGHVRKQKMNRNESAKTVHQAKMRLANCFDVTIILSL